jgi:3-oxoacyl-[acyl-carrier protein] reductase
MNAVDLSGRGAVVTGAARGIGRGIAERLLKSGARVSLWDIDPAALEKTAGALSGLGEVHRAVVDVADDASAEKAAKAARERLGAIDILVNNAGVSGPNLALWECPAEEWHQVIRVNLVGVFHCGRAVVPFMIEKGYGRIVNIASVAGKEGNPNASAYSASKAGVIGLTKSLGKELARTGILVNCITPAAVETDLFRQMTEEHVRFMLSKIPMGRFGRIEEVAAMTAWLCSEECSFTTGGVFDLSGGRATY